MKVHQRTKNDDTGTEAQETSGPASVGELATQVVISSSGYAKMNTERLYRIMKTTDSVLRLRGGGDSESDDGTNASTSGAMAVDQRTSNNPAKAKSASVDSVALLKKLNNHIGFIEQTVISEMTKKLTAGAADGISARLKNIRDIHTELCMENSRFQGVTQFSAAELKGLLDTFSRAHKEKSKEIEELRLENLVLKESLEELANNYGPKKVTYADATSSAIKSVLSAEDAPGPVAPPTTAKGTNREKPKTKASKRKSLDKCRQSAVKTRFVVDVPENMTVAQVKSDLWRTVQKK